MKQHGEMARQAYPDENSDPVGVIVCKQSMHREARNRGYIAMLSVHRDWRKRGIGTCSAIYARTYSLIDSATPYQRARLCVDP